MWLFQLDMLWKLGSPLKNAPHIPEEKKDNRCLSKELWSSLMCQAISESYNAVFLVIP